MVIRKYVATTEDEAVSMAKEELGEDVVIMNVKQISAKGFMKLFRKPSVEITAAVDDIKNEGKKPELSSPGGTAGDSPDFSKLQEAIQETNAVLAAAEAEKEAKKEAKKKAETTEGGQNLSKKSKDILPEPDIFPSDAFGKEKNKKKPPCPKKRGYAAIRAGLRH